jgi:hypothetical protein
MPTICRTNSANLLRYKDFNQLLRGKYVGTLPDRKRNRSRIADSPDQESRWVDHPLPPPNPRWEQAIRRGDDPDEETPSLKALSASGESPDVLA